MWLLAELGVPYELERHARVKMRAPEALQKLHPLGKAPVIVDREAPGGERVIAESGAIIEYLLDAFDGEHKLRPAPSDPRHLDYRYWLHYAEGSLMPPMLVRLIFDQVEAAKLPFFVKPIAKGIAAKVDANFTGPEVERHAKFLDDHLAKHTWFVGDEFTAADVQMVYGVEAILDRGRAKCSTKNIQRWREACNQRPAFRHALDEGGELMPA